MSGSRKDLRVEIRVKNNALWKAIHAKFASVAALCRSQESLKHTQIIIGQLLALKSSPFKKLALREGHYEYRPLALLLEEALKTPAEELFPRVLYETWGGKETMKVVEVDSFTALPGAQQ